MILNRYNLGDMQVIYILDEESKMCELVLLPKDCQYKENMEKVHRTENLVQLKIAGEVYPGAYAGGKSMRNGESTTSLLYESQELVETTEKTCVLTRFVRKGKYQVDHRLTWIPGEEAFRLTSELTNIGDEPIGVEMLSSFSLGGLSPLLQGDGHGNMDLHRLRSSWSMEGRLETRRVEDLLLEPSWANHGVRCERFGQIGSLAVNNFFPYVVLEDKENDVLWGAMLGHSASWQMEVYRLDEGLSLSGGLADREFGHWWKELLPSEIFRSPEALVTVCYGENQGVDMVSHRLVTCGKMAANQGPKSEQKLPLVFNEYCTTWGNPSHDNIMNILDSIDGRGFDYFVIDCGWYKEPGVPWDTSMGDYNVSKDLFPQGLHKTVEAIKSKGLKPGIWFEIENVGKDAKAYQKTDWLLQRDGYTLTTNMRRFWDMRKEEVIDYLSDKVIGTLKKYEFEYMKIDCNDTIGIGCDGAESLGEGLRQNMEASLGFINKVKEEIPEIVLENCASGGHRLEPRMVGATSMSSFSDAHECIEIPIIAANLHRVILPRQSQIWAVIQKDDSLSRIAYSISATFLGRMCLSGHVTNLSKEQWKLIEAGMSLYKRVSHIIKDGYSRRFGPEIFSYRHPEGWQGIFRTYGDEAILILHSYDMKGVLTLSIELDEAYELLDMYGNGSQKVMVTANEIIWDEPDDFQGLVLYMKKMNESGVCME